MINKKCHPQLPQNSFATRKLSTGKREFCDRAHHTLEAGSPVLAGKQPASIKGWKSCLHTKCISLTPPNRVWCHLFLNKFSLETRGDGSGLALQWVTHLRGKSSGALCSCLCLALCSAALRAGRQAELAPFARFLCKKTAWDVQKGGRKDKPW